MHNSELKKTILQLLTMADAIYRTDNSPEEMALIANVFYESFADEKPEEIRRAFMLHMKTSKYFPTPAHIGELLPECRIAPPQRIALEEGGQQTPGFARLAYRALCGDEEAKAQMDALTQRLCKKVSVH